MSSSNQSHWSLPAWWAVPQRLAVVVQGSAARSLWLGISSKSATAVVPARACVRSHEHVLDRFPNRVFAFDEFGPLGIRPTAGSGWAEQRRPDRLPATYHRTHGVRHFHGCYSVGDDRLWGVNRRKKGAGKTLARAARPGGAPM